MTMKPRYIIGIGFLISILVFGCSKEFLNYDQLGATTESTFYKTDEQSLEALMAICDNLQARIHNRQHFALTGLSDDVYAGGGQRGDNGGMIEEINEFRYGPSNGIVSVLFSWNYHGIYLSNILIDNVEANTENKKLYIAMAKFYRAYHYFNLVTLWGDVPLALHELTPSEYAQPRAPKAEIWAQIESDLNDAIADLPVRSQLPEILTDLVSKGTAQSLLGKALLFQEKFDEASQIFDAVISSGEYGLIDDYSQLFRPSSEQGSESVFEVNFSTSKSYSDFSFSARESSWYTAYSMSPRQEFFTPGTGVTADILGGWGFLNPRKGLYQAYTEAGDFVRRDDNIISEADLIAEGGSMRNVNGDLPYGNDGYLRLKLVMHNSDGGQPVPQLNSGTNARVIRYADVLLMAAEANNRKSSPNDAKALQYVNQVRARVDLPALTVTGTQLFEAIKLERRLELAFEGERFQDLVRWGDASKYLADQGKVVPLGTGSVLNLPEAGFKTGKNELFPIPLSELNVNENMTQNPGY